eukprot:TRINITY_DN37046_c0_g1_i2.p1 TRINITY_DN37046_c0_g1~~TRINITY_DN37046_c0_g1_i2.p1  ORF type:complete len:563 (+),score=88.93 TRINITY_DN37046_c0_g1_i2:71-1759(+)
MAPFTGSDTESSVDAFSESAASSATTAVNQLPARHGSSKQIPGAGKGGSVLYHRELPAPTDSSLALERMQGAWDTSRLGRLEVKGSSVVYDFWPSVGGSSKQPNLTLHIEAGSRLALDLWRAEVSAYDNCGYIRWTRIDDALLDDVIVWARPLSTLKLSGAVQSGTCLPATAQHLQVVQGVWETSHFGRLHVDDASVIYKLAGVGVPPLQLRVSPDGRLALDGWRADALMLQGGCLKWTHCDDVEGSRPVVWVRPPGQAQSPPTEANAYSQRPPPAAKSRAKGRGRASDGTAAPANTTRQRQPPSRLVALAEVTSDTQPRRRSKATQGHAGEFAFTTEASQQPGKKRGDSHEKPRRSERAPKGKTKKTSMTSEEWPVGFADQRTHNDDLVPPQSRQGSGQYAHGDRASKRARTAADRNDQLQVPEAVFQGFEPTPVGPQECSVARGCVVAPVAVVAPELAVPPDTTATSHDAVLPVALETQLAPETGAISMEEKRALQRMMDALTDEQLDRILDFLEPELGGADDDEIQLNIDRLTPERQRALVKVVENEIGQTNQPPHVAR